MSDRLTLKLAAYRSRDDAVAAWNRLREADKAGTIRLQDGAVVDRDAEGRITIDERLHHPVAAGMLAGVVVAALTPVGIIVGPALGALAGKLSTRFRNTISDTDARNLGEMLGRNQALVIAITEAGTGDAALDEVFADAFEHYDHEVSVTHAEYNALLADYSGGVKPMIGDR